MTTVANLLRDLGVLVNKTHAYDPKHPRRVEVSVLALQLLGDAAGWRATHGDARPLTVFGLPLDENGEGGAGYAVFAVDGSVLAEGDVTP
jgi:hypothetical protein